eukprot:1361798-Amorphochlora_amoeboformis.AAC.1
MSADRAKRAAAMRKLLGFTRKIQVTAPKETPTRRRGVTAVERARSQIRPGMPIPIHKDRARSEGPKARPRSRTAVPRPGRISASRSPQRTTALAPRPRADMKRRGSQEIPASRLPVVFNSPGPVPFVIDNGSGAIKAGFGTTGNTAKPQAFNAVVGRPKYRRSMVGAT